MAVLDNVKAMARRPPTLIAIAIAVAAIVIAALVKSGILPTALDSRWLPEIIIAVAAVLLLLIIFVGIPWHRERRFVQRLGSGYGAAAERSPEEFQAKFAAAMRRLRNLPRAGGDPAYALPWYLMIGPPDAGKTEALRNAGLFSALTASAEGATANFDCWVSNSMLMLDTAGRYTIPAEVEHDRAEWYRLLRLIRHHHATEPLSGLLVAVAADHLILQPEEKLRDDSSQIRERIEEVIKELAVDLPIYLLVTKADLLDGFVEFFSQLPPRVLDEAIGWIDDPPAQIKDSPQRGADALRRLQQGLETTYERLNVLRASLLNGPVSESLRQPLFCFPEEFRAMGRRLAMILEPLAGQDVRYHTPLLRGLFFSSARQQGQPLSSVRLQIGITSVPVTADGRKQFHYFLRDLFDPMLPRDRALATPGLRRAG